MFLCFDFSRGKQGAVSLDDPEVHSKPETLGSFPKPTPHTDQYPEESLHLSHSHICKESIPFSGVSGPINGTKEPEEACRMTSVALPYVDSKENKNIESRIRAHLEYGINVGNQGTISLSGSEEDSPLDNETLLKELQVKTRKKMNSIAQLNLLNLRLIKEQKRDLLTKRTGTENDPNPQGPIDAQNCSGNGENDALEENELDEGHSIGSSSTNFAETEDDSDSNSSGDMIKYEIDSSEDAPRTYEDEDSSEFGNRETEDYGPSRSYNEEVYLYA